MSKYLVPPQYKGRALELQWMNNTVQGHDLMCGCGDPFKHLHYLLKQNNHQLCLPSTSDHGEEDGKHGDDAVDTLLEGELEELFQQDFEEDDG